MTQVEVKTEINAPASAVYAVLMDFPAYKEWNPMIPQISGTPEVGQQIQADVKIGDRAPVTFKTTVLTNEANKELRWVGCLLAAFLYRGEHYFRIEETQAGCVFVHGEQWSGLLEPLITRMVGKDTLENSFKGFNDGLKARVEATGH